MGTILAIGMLLGTIVTASAGSFTITTTPEEDAAIATEATATGQTAAQVVQGLSAKEIQNLVLRQRQDEAARYTRDFPKLTPTDQAAIRGLLQKAR